MEQKKSFNHYMRLLHRDIGFFVIGFAVIYALSGIILTYRDSGLLKTTVHVEKKLPAHLEPSKLGEMLRMHDFRIVKTEGEKIYFGDGFYDGTNGQVSFDREETLPFLDRYLRMHKSSSHDAIHWVNLIFRISLFFLAISSFWMFKKGTRLFRRGVIISIAGLVMALILVYL